MIFGPAATGVMILAGMLEGHGQVENAAFTSEDLKFFLPVVLPGRLSIRFAEDGTLQGNVAKGSGTGSVIDGGKVAWLDYDAPARVADVAGTWAMRNMTGNDFQISIGSDGSLNGNWGPCSLNGTISPRASGKKCTRRLAGIRRGPLSVASCGLLRHRRELFPDSRRSP